MDRYRANKTIAILKQGLWLTQDHELKSLVLSALGEIHYQLFLSLDRPRDIHMAIEHFSRSVSATPDGHAFMNQRLGNLGGGYVRRFERMNRIEDIDRAIRCYQEAQSLTSDRDPYRLALLSNLASAYDARNERLGHAEDAVSAMTCQMKALSLTPDDDPDKASRLSNFISIYQRLSHCYPSHDLLDHDTEVECDRIPLDLTPDGDPQKPQRLHCLGTSLCRRYRSSGNVCDIDEAIRCGNRAISLVSDKHPSLSAFLDTLGQSYKTRFDLLREISDIDAAIKCQKRAVAISSNDHPDGAIWLQNLGNSCLIRFKHQSERADIEKAVHYFEKVARYSAGHPFTRFNSARDCARLCVQHGIFRSLQAYGLAMALIPQVIWLGAPVDVRYRQVMREIAGVATEAAGTAISLQQYDLAIEWLEQGRSIIWGQSLLLRRPIDDLSKANSTLAADIQHTAYELDSLIFSDSGQEHQVNSERQRRLAERWEGLVHNVRLIPGFHGFLQPHKPSELLTSAQGGAVVIINAHAARCDALVLQPGASDIIHIPLVDLSLEKIILAQTQLQNSLHRAGLLTRGVKVVRAKSDDIFRKILAMLWTDLVEPIVKFLGYEENLPVEELPRITWCTTGPLSFLPIHAAGIYEDPFKTLYKLVVSSYTPTLSALLASSPSPKPFLGIMTIGQASTPGHPDLPGTLDELMQIKKQIGGHGLTQLDGGDATTSAVLKGMEEHSWVHFACHATQHPTEPERSSFHLHDGALDMRKIAQRPLKQADLAFLSACQTATGDQKLPDEAIHLASAMIMAGYSTVIATMWSIGDYDASFVAGRFYARLLATGAPNARGAARALHSAVDDLREEAGGENFARWVPYIHMGV
ncbi:hypothetical protein FRC09_020355 [Ceratobasidium sp. 395]|nr:hypothetical protein FRC09_020355 [Ceratobasidium sp. 395]